MIRGQVFQKNDLILVEYFIPKILRFFDIFEKREPNRSGYMTNGKKSAIPERKIGKAESIRRLNSVDWERVKDGSPSDQAGT